MGTAINDSELETFVIAISVLKRKISDSFLSSCEGFAWGHMAVLARIAQEEGSTIASLARDEHMKPQSMRAIVEHLLAEGLIAKVQHPADQRKHLFRLTRRGKIVRAEAIKSKISWVRKSLSGLSEEEKSVFRKSIGILSKLSREGQPTGN